MLQPFNCPIKGLKSCTLPPGVRHLEDEAARYCNCYHVIQSFCLIVGVGYLEDTTANQVFTAADQDY